MNTRLTTHKESPTQVKILILIVIISTSLYNFAYAKTKIGITQITAHISLDANRKGIEDALVQNKNIELYFQNAQGNLILANQIATKFISKKMDIIVSISTPSTLSLLTVRNNINIPIVFSGVTDPISAKIVSSLQNQGNNITGAIDTPPLEKLIEIVTTITGAKKIGIIYNPAEANSVRVLSLLKVIAKNSKIYPVSVNNSATVLEAANKLIGQVDAIILPSDNTVFTVLEQLTKVTTKAKIPVFSSDSDSVQKGVMLSVGYSQYEVGKLAGEKILEIVNGQKAETIPITTPLNYEVVINKNMVDEMGINIDKKILAKAKIIERKR